MRQGHSLPHILLANAVTLWGGGERFVVDAGCGLRDRGWRVTVQAQPHSPLARAAAEAGLSTHTVRTRANGAPWTVLPLRRWLEREAVDLVLTNFDRDLRTTGLAARLARRPIRVVHSFECAEPLKERWYLPWIYTSLAHSFLFNSRCTEGTVLASAPRLAERPRRILYKGVAIPDEPMRDPARSPTVLGFAGQLIERKSLPLLVRALAALPPTLSWQLKVAGIGPARETWEALVRDAGLHDRVEFCGFVDDVPAWLAGIDLLVHPARREGFGYTPVETLAAGIPLIARAGGSVEEILGRCPATAWFEDESGLQDRLMKWIGDGAAAGVDRRDAAREFVRAHYGLDRMADELDTHLRTELTFG